MTAIDPESGEPREEGAIEELARDPASRRRFLRAVGGTGATAAFAAFLAACNGSSTTSRKTPGGSDATTAPGTGTDLFGPGDLGIALFALQLEDLEVSFYTQALGSGKVKGTRLAMLRRFGAQEAAHQKTLAATVAKLGGKRPKPVKGQFNLGSEQSILSTAAALENLGAAAYLGQATRIQSKSLLAAALSIHSVEGRHAAALNAELGKDIAPDGAFARPQFAGDVLAAVQPFLSA